MKPAVGGSKQDSFLALCVHKATINYINDQEDLPCFLFNYFYHIDHEQFIKSVIVKTKLKQNVIKTFNQT